MNLVEQYKELVKEYDGSYFIFNSALRQIHKEKIYTTFFFIANGKPSKTITNESAFISSMPASSLNVYGEQWIKDCIECGYEKDVKRLIKSIVENRVDVKIELLKPSEEQDYKYNTITKTQAYSKIYYCWDDFYNLDNILADWKKLRKSGEFDRLKNDINYYAMELKEYYDQLEQYHDYEILRAIYHCLC